MFGRLHLLLALACVAVLFGEALSQSYCNYTYIGRLVGTAIPLQKVTLNGYYSDFSVYVPTVPQCGVVNGVYAAACDYDVVPVAKFESMSVLKVHRNGQLAQPGSVALTVYCN